MTQANTNRNFKDSVFTLLFGEKNNLLELYNAIENTSYGSDTDVQITTLRDALFMEQINDISFVIEGKLVVLMPIRMLLSEPRFTGFSDSPDFIFIPKICTAMCIFRK